jgi:hypothetical protein
MIPPISPHRATGRIHTMLRIAATRPCSASTCNWSFRPGSFWAAVAGPPPAEQRRRVIRRLLEAEQALGDVRRVPESWRLSPGSWLPLSRFQCLQVFVQSIEALRPEVLVMRRPVGDGFQRLGLQTAGAPLRVASSRNQRPARSSTFRCLETAGCDIAKGSASSLTVASPDARRARIARRVGSARAPKIASRCSVRIIRVDRSLCHSRCQSGAVEERSFFMQALARPFQAPRAWPALGGRCSSYSQNEPLVSQEEQILNGIDAE